MNGAPEPQPELAHGLDEPALEANITMFTNGVHGDYSEQVGMIAASKMGITWDGPGNSASNVRRGHRASPAKPTPRTVADVEAALAHARDRKLASVGVLEATLRRPPAGRRRDFPVVRNAP